jgi:HSP20 family protein
MIKLVIQPEPIQLSGRIPENPASFLKDPFRWRISTRAHIWCPPTDVFETEDEVVVRVEIAGMKEEDFSISLSGRELLIRGVRPNVEERKAYHRMEIFFGEFMSKVELPGPVLVDRVQAHYKSGFLRIVLPKQKAQKIHVED